MKLYCKIPKPKKFKFHDPIKNAVDYTKSPVLLYPDEPTEVSEKDAKRLLRQDPHLVSTEPFIAPEVEEKQVPMSEYEKLRMENETLKQALTEKKEEPVVEEPIKEEPEKPVEETPEELVEEKPVIPEKDSQFKSAEQIISRANKMKNMKVTDLVKIGASIGLEIKSVGKKKVDIIKIITTKAETILGAS